MKKARSKKHLSGRALARLITVFVFLASSALVTLTVILFMRTLSGVAIARKIDTTKSAKLAGINGTMLDSLLQFHAERTARKPIDTTHIKNPFIPLPPPPPDAILPPTADSTPTAPPAAPPKAPPISGSKK
jgi:hypothetical protein